jgi:hypothetical protein
MIILSRIIVRGTPLLEVLKQIFQYSDDDILVYCNIFVALKILLFMHIGVNLKDAKSA